MPGPIEKWWHGEEYHDCERLGITIERAPVTEGYHARCVAIHLMTWDENRDNHNEYFDAANEAGQRLSGTVIIGQNNNIHLRAVIDKPPNEPGTNFPVHNQDTISAWVGEVPGLGVIPSDKVHGFSTRWGGAIVGGQNYGHISIWVLWMIKRGAIEPPPVEPPPPAGDYEALRKENEKLREENANLRSIIVSARDMLDKV